MSPVRTRPASALTMGLGGRTSVLSMMRRGSSASQAMVQALPGAQPARGGVSDRPPSAPAARSVSAAAGGAQTSRQLVSKQDVSSIASAAALAASQLQTNARRAEQRKLERAEARANRRYPSGSGSSNNSRPQSAAGSRMSAASLQHGVRDGATRPTPLSRPSTAGASRRSAGSVAMAPAQSAPTLSRPSTAGSGGASTVPKASTGVRLPPSDLILLQFYTKYNLDLESVVAAATATDVDANVAASQQVLHPGMRLSFVRFVAYITHKAAAQPMLVWLLLTKLGLDDAPAPTAGRGTHGGTPGGKTNAKLQHSSRGPNTSGRGEGVPPLNLPLKWLESVIREAADVPVPGTAPQSFWSWLEEPARKALPLNHSQRQRSSASRSAIKTSLVPVSPMRTAASEASAGVPAATELSATFRAKPVLANPAKRMSKLGIAPTSPVHAQRV